jgi:hypothetical protein
MNFSRKWARHLYLIGYARVSKADGSQNIEYQKVAFKEARISEQNGSVANSLPG